MHSSSKPPADSHLISHQIVQTVAEQAGTDPLELPPLYETIDAEGLDMVIESLDDGAVEFQYADRVVTVTSEGRIDVTGDVQNISNSAEPALDD